MLSLNMATVSLGVERKLLRTHETIFDGEIFRCDRCDYKARIKGNLRCHILAEHENKRFECHLCEYKVKRNS